MTKSLFGILGVILFSVGVITVFSLLKNESQASKLDDTRTAFGMISDEGPPPCTWNVTQPERVMTESKSQAVLIQATNSQEKECESTLALRAPGFDISPAREEQKINVPSQGQGSLSWILTPRKTGTYEMAVSDILNTQVFGITVTNLFGLSAIHAKIFSVLGTLFGPMLTVPWWWDRWRQRKPKQEAAKENEVK